MLDLKIKISIAVVLIALFVTRQIYKSKKEHFGVEETNQPKYLKISETNVPVKKEVEVVEGNLEQCQAKCDLDNKCIGFVREKTNDTNKAKCYIIKDVLNCHNEHKEPSDKYILSPGISEDNQLDSSKYFEYDTYFKTNLSPRQNDSIQKCVRLDQQVSVVPRKNPFGVLVLDENNNLKVINKDNQVEHSKDAKGTKFYAKNAVINIVKGLKGSGVSFKINRDNMDYYVTIKENGEGENVVCELHEDSLTFKKRASFTLDMEHAESETHTLDNVKYLSIKNDIQGVISYLKVHSVTNKLVQVRKDNLDKDLQDIMFEFRTHLPYKELETNNSNSNSKGPSPSVSLETVVESEPVDMKGMGDELEKLELDIREAQHGQNLKLMNIMLDVNKFKLHDLSMSNYLTKCTNSDSEEAATYINTKIQGEQERLSPAV